MTVRLTHYEVTKLNLRCPKCRTLIQYRKAVRMCADCRKPIGRHGKFIYVQRGRGRKAVTVMVHRDCDRPNSYPPGTSF